MPDPTWEDTLEFLTTQMADDLDVIVGQAISHDEITGIPHWVLIMTDNNEATLTARLGDAISRLGGEVIG